MHSPKISNKSSPPIVATIDLHGHTKERAISQLTAFLSDSVKRHQSGRKPIWVLVITGSGKHSQNGPVLRHAVQSTLDKRHMSYKINNGKGSFTVRADSGFELVSEGPKHDTKVILSSKDYRLRRGAKYPLRQNDVASLREGDAPLPSDVKADDEAMETGKKLSAEEERLRRKNETKERKQLEMAMEVSMKEEQEEQKMLEEAMALSQMEKERQESALMEKTEEERKMIEEAVAMSQRELKEREEREKQEIEDAIKKSLEANPDEMDDEINAAIQKSIEEQRMWMTGGLNEQHIPIASIYGSDTLHHQRQHISASMAERCDIGCLTQTQPMEFKQAHSSQISSRYLGVNNSLTEKTSHHYWDDEINMVDETSSLPRYQNDGHNETLSQEITLGERMLLSHNEPP